MAKPQKRKLQSGRVTPKGTQPRNTSRVRSGRLSDNVTELADTSVPDYERHYSSGYVPGKVSPTWVPVLMFGLLILGGLTIILNYLRWLPQATNNWYLIFGLGFILGGIITATQLH